MQALPVIGITMGDPAGIGPEIVCKTLNNPELYETCRPLVIGSLEPMEKALQSLNLDLEIHCVNEVKEGTFKKGVIDLIDIPMDYAFEPGVLRPENGEISITYMKRVHELIATGEIHVTASAPCNKEAMKMAGSPFVGATELFASLAGIKKPLTVIQQGGCYFFQVTTHVSLRQALDSLDKGKIAESIQTAYATLQSWGIKNPVIAVSGINPHCGEGGLLGSEEMDFVIPAIQEAVAVGIDVRGPVPADSIFVKAYQGAYDCALLMFHDTANIGIKLMTEEKPAAVISAGLPFVRTTVAHGTAYDIAYQNKANHIQFETCVNAAVQIGARIAKN